MLDLYHETTCVCQFDGRPLQTDLCANAQFDLSVPIVDLSTLGIF